MISYELFQRISAFSALGFCFPVSMAISLKTYGHFYE